jgi:dienelactone hydrolase
MRVVTSTLEYRDGDTLLEGFVARDEDQNGPRPLVLIAHMWGGRVEFVEKKAQQLAELGYVGFALDMYGKGVTGETPDQCTALMTPFMEDRALLQRRMRCAVDAARRMSYVNETKIAAIGFCFGGLCVLELARISDDVAGVVSFHGLLTPPDNLERSTFNSRVMVLHGREDPMVSGEEIESLQRELSDSDVDWQFISFGRAMHAFTNPGANDPDMGTVYQAAADRRSWAYMIRFLGEMLF